MFVVTIRRTGDEKAEPIAGLKHERVKFRHPFFESPGQVHARIASLFQQIAEELRGLAAGSPMNVADRADTLRDGDLVRDSRRGGKDAGLRRRRGEAVVYAGHDQGLEHSRSL